MASFGDSVAEVLCVPVDDDGGQEVEACHAEVLALGCAVADLALAVDAQGILEGMMCLALVQVRMHATGEYSISDLAELFAVSRPIIYRTLHRSKAKIIR